MNCKNSRYVPSGDRGNSPTVADMDLITAQNQNFRTAFWTGKHLQVTLMSIPVGGEIGLELHEETDQFIRITEGCATIMFGLNENSVRAVRRATAGQGIFIPAGIWHNLKNAGNRALKLYSVYAPPHHPAGLTQETASDAK